MPFFLGRQTHLATLVGVSDSSRHHLAFNPAHQPPETLSLPFYLPTLPVSELETAPEMLA
jgi:hypothetical protein